MKLPWRSASLATRLGLAFSAGLALLALVLGLGVHWQLRAAVEAGLREDLSEGSRLLQLAADDIVLRPGDVERDFLLEAEGLRRPWLRITEPSVGEQPLFESKSLARLKVAPFPKPSAKGLPVVRWRGPDGRPYRLASAWIETSALFKRRFLAQWALDAGREERLLGGLRRRLFVTALLGVVLAFVLGRALAARGLAPLRRIGRAAAGMSPEQLRQRLEPEGWPREIGELAAAFNAMLAGLDERFERLRRHSGELSHELRTPLHQLRMQAEVLLSQPRDGAEYRRALEGQLEALGRLSQTVDSVLFLAREADPASALTLERFDCGQDLQELAELFEPMAAQRGLRILVHGGGPVRADRGLLRRALGNLLSNAVRHALPGSEIRLSAEPGEGRLRFQVLNDGPAPASELRERLFEPFVRGDGQARGDGTGLGLAIVRRIAQLHGGRAWLEAPTPDACAACLDLPA